MQPETLPCQAARMQAAFTPTVFTKVDPPNAIRVPFVTIAVPFVDSVVRSKYKDLLTALSSFLYLIKKSAAAEKIPITGRFIRYQARGLEHAKTDS